MRKIRWIPLLLAFMLPGLPGCRGEEMTEEERQQLIAEMGEQGRAYQEKRSRFLESPLCAGGRAYLDEVLRELVPDGTVSVSLEPGGYIDAGEEALASPPDTDAAKLGFFRLADAVITVNFWDFGMDGELLARALMARGISGRLMADEFNSAEWILDAVSGELEYYVYPGV